MSRLQLIIALLCRFVAAGMIVHATMVGLLTASSTTGIVWLGVSVYLVAGLLLFLLAKPIAKLATLDL